MNHSDHESIDDDLIFKQALNSSQSNFSYDKTLLVLNDKTFAGSRNLKESAIFALMFQPLKVVYNSAIQPSNVLISCLNFAYLFACWIGVSHLSS